MQARGINVILRKQIDWSKMQNWYFYLEIVRPERKNKEKWSKNTYR